jgi:hypothetical protein
MCKPCGAYGQEADDVLKIEGPRGEHALERASGRFDRELQHQQRDGDGEDAVTEGLETASGPSLPRAGLHRAGQLDLPCSR